MYKNGTRLIAGLEYTTLTDYDYDYLLSTVLYDYDYEWSVLYVPFHSTYCTSGDVDDRDEAT
jgi:hypothetical protein